MTHAWIIFGDPVGKGRPRFAGARLGRVHAYTPSRTANWEGLAVSVFRAAWGGAPIDEPVELDVEAVFSRPKRLMRDRDPAGRLPHTAKPDFDNIAKCVGDSLEKAGVLRNDSQVVSGRVTKCYAAKSEGPRVEVRLRVIAEAVNSEEGYGDG